MEKDTTNSNPRTEISLQEVTSRIHFWIKHLLSKWVAILVIGIIGAVIGVGYALYTKPQYTALTSFVLEEGANGGGGGLGQYAGLAALVGIDIGGGGEGIFQGDNITALYKSRAMLAKVLLTTAEFGDKNQLFIERYVEFRKLRNKWKGKPDLINIKFTKQQGTSTTRLQDSIINEVVEDINKKNLIVEKPDKKLNIINVVFTCEDEVFSKKFNNAIVSTVNEFYVETKTKKALQNISILQHQTDSVKAVMNGAIYSAAAINDATPNLNPTKQIQRIAPVQRSQFSAETNKAILGELVKNLELSKMNLLKEKPLIQVIDEPIYPLKKEEMSLAKMGIFGFILGIIGVVFVLVFKEFSRQLRTTNQ